jgi:hypothetical protein
MAYYLGIDLGTTYTAAARYRDGVPEMVSLGNRSTVVPSAVLVTREGEFLIGEAALRRGTVEPERLAREFKRRIGDSVPLLLGGSPLSAEALSARLLRWVIDRVSQMEGGPPSRVALTFPANWGLFKQELLAQVIRLAEVGSAVTLTEPDAAAISYAATERVAVGETIAVYDLGGGTFDAAILRKTAAGFDLLGEPEGIEQLGGIDIDEAVFDHVRQAAADAFADLDLDDSATVAAVARLRRDCVDAKEVLSADTDVTIPRWASLGQSSSRSSLPGCTTPSAPCAGRCAPRACSPRRSRPCSSSVAPPASRSSAGSSAKGWVAPSPSTPTPSTPSLSAPRWRPMVPVPVPLPLPVLDPVVGPPISRMSAPSSSPPQPATTRSRAEKSAAAVCLRTIMVLLRKGKPDKRRKANLTERTPPGLPRAWLSCSSGPASPECAAVLVGRRGAELSAPG